MLMDQFDSSGGVKLDRCVFQMIVDYFTNKIHVSRTYVMLHVSLMSCPVPAG